MPVFMVNFGDTLDGLGGVPDDGEVQTVSDSVKDFVVIFVILGALAGLAGFAMVSLWSIAGECQVSTPVAKNHYGSRIVFNNSQHV